LTTHRALWPMVLIPLLTVSVPAVGQNMSGWSSFGRALGGGGAVDRELAYQQGLRLGLERQAAIQAAQEREYLTSTRASLAKFWARAGYSEEDARAIAAAYEPAASEAAVVAAVRRKRSLEVAPDIRKALSDNNFLLANQLVIGWALVDSEERAKQPSVPHEAAPQP
jgi:hypothetical protein